MACVWIRLFPAFRRRRQQLPNTFVAPSMPSSIDVNQTSLEQIAPKDDVEFPYLGFLAQQGSCTLVVSNIPSDLDLENLDTTLCSLSGFISRRYDNTEGRSDNMDIIVNFGTAAEAAMALATQPTISIGNGQRRSLEYANIQEPEILVSAPVYKRVKVETPPAPPPQCQICGDELPGLYSTPCFFCKSVWCHECLGNQFRSALNDQERFPAKCCGRVFHYDVARSIISEDHYKEYRTRFEQYNTTKPIYCANVRCSTFLPSRIAKPDNRGHVHCPTCNIITCKNCRDIVEPFEAESHQCVTADEITSLLKQFNYKRCPRCNAGIAKMFGCPHFRCSCGAHWCWDCQRPIQVCWSQPCERAREEGEESDGYQIPEDSEDEGEGTSQNITEDAAPIQQQVINTENTDQVHAQIVETAVEDHANNENIGTLPAGEAIERPTSTEDTATVAADNVIASPGSVGATIPVVAEPFVNLDGSEAYNWETGSFDFGNEPVDESWDTWGCLHHFVKVQDGLVLKSKHWLPDMPLSIGTNNVPSKQIDCLKCFKTITFSNRSKELREDTACIVSAGQNSTGAIAAQIIEDQRAGSDIPSNDSLPATSTETTQSDTPKTRKPGEVSRLYNCRRCGLFYCVGCKKTALRQAQNLLDRRTYS